MNQLTLDFFSNPHPGFHKTVTIFDDVLVTDVPIVEIPIKLDTESILSDIITNGEFNPHVRPKFNFEKIDRISNWHKAHLYQTEDIEQYRYCTNLSEKILGDEVLPAINVDQKMHRSFIDQLDKIGLVLKWCHIMQLGPGGYLTPHRDLNSNQHPLNYFWIPLNWPEGSKLGVYPIGEVKINLGSIYLLNQKNYVHSVANFGNQNRYILNGMFKLPIDQKFSDLVRNNIKNQYQ